MRPAEPNRPDPLDGLLASAIQVAGDVLPPGRAAVVRRWLARLKGDEGDSAAPTPAGPRTKRGKIKRSVRRS